MKDDINIESTCDEDLIKKYQSTNNLHIVGILFKRYSHLILGVCLKYLKDSEKAKDASMDIFESLTIQLKKHSVKSFKSWLYIITKNHCLQILRKEKRIGYTSLSDYSEPEDLSGIQGTLAIQKEVKLSALEEALEDINPVQAQCIRMFFFEKLSYDQIATKTTESRKSVKSHIQNGKRNLKLKLQQHHAFKQ